MMRPANEKELSEAIAGATGPLRIIGGGTRGVFVEGEELSTTALTGISLYDPGALTIVAGAGTPLAEIEAALAAEGQRLPFEPMDHRGLLGTKGEPTIGGVVAANISGPRRIQAGACRDSLIGVRFVDGTGTVLKNGGRVMKNVTGYDLVKLMAGSYGTLGVISEVAFKVLPEPETQATLFLSNLSDIEAIKAMSAACSSPFDISGAAHAPACVEEEPTTMIRIEGFAESVAYRAKQLQARLAAFGETTVSDGVESWSATRNLVCFPQVVRPDGVLWRVSLKPSDAPAFIANLDEEVEVLYSFDWAGGLVWVWCASDANAESLHHSIQAGAAQLAGHATLIKADNKLRRKIPVFQPEAAPIAAISAGLRTQFDPRGILNAGLMD